MTDPAPPVMPVETEMPACEVAASHVAPAPPAPVRVAHPEAVFVASANPAPAPAPAPMVVAEKQAGAPVNVVVADPVAQVARDVESAPSPLVPMPISALAPAIPLAADTLFSARTRRTQILRAAGVAVLAIALGAGGRWKMKHGAHSTAATTAAPVATAPAVSAPAATSAVGVAAGKGNQALPPEGTAEIATSEGTPILIDGVERGHGPQLSVTLPIGVHALRTGVDARTRSVQINRGRVTHVDLTGTSTPAP